jgi:hypothetical protein
MRTFVAITTAVVGVAVAIISTAIASGAASGTIEQCAALLPQGKTYTFEVSGSVDTTGSKPKLTGEMSVSDGTETDRTAESAAFAQCIAKLIK